METRATEYAVKITECKDLNSLRSLWMVITNDRVRLGEWYPWLADLKDSQKIRLQPEEEPTWLTREGQKWIKS